MNIQDVQAVQAVIKNLNQQADKLDDLGLYGLAQHIDSIVIDLETDIERAVKSGPLVEAKGRR